MGKNQLIPPKQVTGSEIAQKFIGLTPARFAETRELAFVQKRMDRASSEKKADFMGELARARAEAARAEIAGDGASLARAESEIGKIYANMAEWNKGKAVHEHIKIEPTSKALQQRTREEIMGYEARKGRKAARGMREEVERVYRGNAASEGLPAR